MQLLLITADPPMAKMAIESGVDLIFVDLEIAGKVERQGHRDTVISGHSIADVQAIAQVVARDHLLVRVNPLAQDSAEEIDRALDAGAGHLMLPMFHHVDEVERFTDLVDGRAGTVGLFETPAALARIESILATGRLDQVHFGLNDLSLAMRLDFLFEVLAGGLLNHAVECCKRYGVPFGIGGIGRIGTGDLPADLILAEHERLGSSGVILSRAFTQGKKTLADLPPDLDFGAAIRELRSKYIELGQRSNDEREDDRRQLVDATWAVADKIRRARS